MTTSAIQSGPASGFPERLLYATSARIGGVGLDSVAHQALKASYAKGFLGRAIGYANQQSDIPASCIQSLRWHPVRLLSGLDRPYYYGAKKKYVDFIASRQLRSGRFDMFHSWSGDCLNALRTAREMGIPTLMECATWHRNKGKIKPRITENEMLRAAQGSIFQRGLNRLRVNRQQILDEYDLADTILVLSECAVNSFLAAGIPREKLFKLERGVDADRFTPAEQPPEVFRAVFVGALIKRKGVHHLLQAWHKLALKNAELVLVGSVHPEIEPYLREFASPTIKVAGFVASTERFLQDAALQIFPSTCEGSAKVTYEAAACGLPQIATRESGDVVIDEETGIIVPPENEDALAAAIERLYLNRDLMVSMGRAARKRIVEHYTWDHFRERLLEAYRLTLQKRR